MERIRITYEKTGAMRYTSHLDQQKVWMRALLRAKLPLAYTQGFHPTPKVAYAWPLPLGWGTKGELMDIWLDDPDGKETDESWFIETVNDSLPAGLRILSIEKLPPYGSPALTIAIQSASYQILFSECEDERSLISQMTELMSQPTIERERRGKIYDMKPLIENWDCRTTEDGEVVMNVQMAARDSAMGRPDELVSALGYDPFLVNIVRLRYFLSE